jgi:hypothetical protein
VDKINSLQADMLLSEEIDIELNKSLIKFINTRYGKNNVYRKGFEQSQKRIDDLRTLVTETELIATFKEQLNSNVWVDTVTLPSNYMYLVSQQSKIIKRPNCKKVSFSLQTTTIDDLRPFFVIGLSDFVCNNNSTIADSIILYEDINDLTAGSITMWTNSGVTFPADIASLISGSDSIPNNSNAGFEVFWEEYGQLNYPGSFIVTINTNSIPWFQWDASLGTVSTLASVDSNTNILQTAVGINSELDYNERRLISNTHTESILVGNSFVQHDDIFTLLGDPFNTTKHTDPLTTIRGNSIDIYTNDIFIIDTVKITYIRNPRKISLSLGIDCELPEHTHQAVVDMTVSSILEGISDPRYKSHELEVSKNE